jgi:hypothetical protein
MVKEPPAGSKMDFELPKEKAVPAPKIADQPKLSSSQDLRRAVLTVKEPPASSKLAKVAFASVLLLALGWAGVHNGIDKQLDASWRAIMAVVKGYVVQAPARAPVSLGTATPTSFDNLSAEPKLGTPTADKNPGVQ